MIDMTNELYSATYARRKAEEIQAQEYQDNLNKAEAIVKAYFVPAIRAAVDMGHMGCDVCVTEEMSIKCTLWVFRYLRDKGYTVKPDHNTPDEMPGHWYVVSW